MEQLKKTPLKNEKGFATIEATVLMVLFVTLIYYTLGFFGIVHTAVLHNIHARTYVFETFRHRSNLMYFRSNKGTARVEQYYPMMSRLHGINTDVRDNPSTQQATERPISMGFENDLQGRNVNTHNNRIYSNRVPASGRATVEVNPVWIMTMYGICLSNRCGE